MSDVNSFSSAVQKIKDTVCKHGSYTPYISFTILDTLYGDFKITTNDSDRCMITSFENVKNGSGQANSFTVTIAYIPSNDLFYKFGNIDFTDINLIDRALNLNAKSDTETTTDEDGKTKTTSLRKCKIQYGYGYPVSILTKEYEGFILDYTTEISNGALTYTITGYSGIAVTCKDTKITIEGSSEEASSDDSESEGEDDSEESSDSSEDSDASEQSMDYEIAAYSDEEDSEDDTDDSEDSEDSDDEEDDSEDSEEPIVMQAVKKKPTEIVSDLYEKYIKDNTDYVLEFAEDTEGTDKEIEMPTAQNVSIFEYMRTVLGEATYENDDDDTDPNERCTYHFLIDDVEKKLIVKRYDPNKAQIENEKNAIRFSWMGPTSKDAGFDYASNAMVLDFKTQFKGSVSMAYDYSEYVDKIVKSGINSAGETVQAKGTGSPTTGSNTENDNSSNLNLWANRLQYCYTATLTTLGIPYEMKILDNIYVAPMILGQEHHTGGLYKITKITDSIDPSGFITSFELSRNQAPGISEQYKEQVKKFQEDVSHLDPNSLMKGKYKDLDSAKRLEELSALVPST